MLEVCLHTLELVAGLIVVYVAFIVSNSHVLLQVHRPTGQHQRGDAEEGGRDHGGAAGARQGVEAGQVHPALPRDPAEDPGGPAAAHAVRLPVRAGHHLHRVLRQLLLRGEGPADRYPARPGPAQSCTDVHAQ